MDGVCHAQRNVSDDHLHDRTVGIEAGCRELFRHTGLTRGRAPFPVLCNLPFCFDFDFYDIRRPCLFSHDRWNSGRDLHYALLFQTMDPAVEGCGRNSVRLIPVEVCQSALAARLDQPELFLRTCAFPAHFRSLHILLFLTASRFACFCYFTIRIPLCLYVFSWRAYFHRPLGTSSAAIGGTDRGEDYTLRSRIAIYSLPGSGMRNLPL